ncbi:MAG: TrkA family potassium uptake protein [Micrococcaceae bacterium]
MADKKEDQVLIIGLGRFGAATALETMMLGREVMGIERKLELVDKYSSKLTYVVQADATNMEALEQLGAGDFRYAIVGVATSVEASVLITANLVDLGIPNIWAKALTPSHGKILERIGAHHVIYPEADAGERVAHLLSGRLLDFIEFDDGFSIAKMYPPKGIVGLTYSQAGIRNTQGVTIVGTKKPGQAFEFAVDDSVIDENEVMILSGQVEDLEKFSERS